MELDDDDIVLAQAADIADGTGRELVALGRMIALYRVGDEFFALDGVCQHQGGPLGKGCLTGHVVTCPWHGWQYDVRSGQHQISSSVRQPSIPVRVVEGQVVARRQDLQE